MEVAALRAENAAGGGAGGAWGRADGEDDRALFFAGGGAATGRAGRSTTEIEIDVKPGRKWWPCGVDRGCEVAIARVMSPLSSSVRHVLAVDDTTAITCWGDGRLNIE